jgi:hypothetical protein
VTDDPGSEDLDSEPEAAIRKPAVEQVKLRNNVPSAWDSTPLIMTLENGRTTCSWLSNHSGPWRPASSGAVVCPAREMMGRNQYGWCSRNASTFGRSGGSTMKDSVAATLVAKVQARILLLRGQRVMLSMHLAELYGVEPKVLVQAVKRNASRFPEDFMFQLSREEFANLKSQIVTSSWGGLRRATPYAFTEQGVAMLSSILNSPRAIHANIEIMRAFVRLRQILASHEGQVRKLEELEKKYDAQFRMVFDAIRQLMAVPEKTRRSIGFTPSVSRRFKVEEARPKYRRRTPARE